MEKRSCRTRTRKIQLRVLCAAAAVFAACALHLTGCKGGDPGDQTGAGMHQKQKNRPASIRSVRDLGITTNPAENVKPSKLSKEALAFYRELDKIHKTGKAPAPEHTAEEMESMKSAGKPLAMRFGGSAAGNIRKKMGVTAGGMQDIGQTRKIIDAGKVPAPEMISVEGFLSEHDIPLEGAPTGKGDLYASASVAWGKRYGKNKPEAVVQIGFGIDMEMSGFRRDSLNLAVVLDVSGSMNGGKIEAARKALAVLADRLGPKDRLALILFNSQAWVLRFSAPVTDRDKLKKTISGIKAGGSTNIEAGLKLGYQQVAAHLSQTDLSPRVFLLTDACPNVGATQAGGFKPMMEGAAAKGIGISAFGLGIDFGQKLAYEIFQVKGGNYFFLENDEKIAKVFDREFDFMVTPVAYGVNIFLVPAEGAEVTDVLGVPDYTKNIEGVRMKIPTLFLSAREGGGATMVALDVEPPDMSKDLTLAVISLSFVDIKQGKRIRHRLEAFLPNGLDPEGEKPYYSQPGAKKALVLADAATALKAACRGQKAPSPEDIRWFTGGRKAAASVQPEITLTKEQAASAAEGLGRFADWFATQIVDIDGALKELRTVEKLESTLRSTAGLPAVSPRTLPGEIQPDTAPPDIF